MDLEKERLKLKKKIEKRSHMTAKAIAQDLGIERHTVYNICKKYDIPYKKEGNRGGRALGAVDIIPRTRRTKEEMAKHRLENKVVVGGNRTQEEIDKEFLKNFEEKLANF